MADAHVVLEHRHGGGLADGAHQRFPPARDHHVDIFVKFAQEGDGGTVRGLHNLHGVDGQARAFKGLMQQARQREVGTDSFRTTAQDDGVPSLEAKDGRINGNVGA